MTHMEITRMKKITHRVTLAAPFVEQERTLCAVSAAHCSSVLRENGVSFSVNQLYKWLDPRCTDRYKRKTAGHYLPHGVSVTRA